MSYKPSNREKKLRAKKAKFWCGCCDMALVGQHGKCPVCGRIEGKGEKKNKNNL